MQPLVRRGTNHAAPTVMHDFAFLLVKRNEVSCAWKPVPRFFALSPPQKELWNFFLVSIYNKCDPESCILTKRMCFENIHSTGNYLPIYIFISASNISLICKEKALILCSVSLARMNIRGCIALDSYVWKRRMVPDVYPEVPHRDDRWLRVFFIKIIFIRVFHEEFYILITNKRHYMIALQSNFTNF